jgi:hypothetical protein
VSPSTLFGGDSLACLPACLGWNEPSPPPLVCLLACFLAGEGLVWVGGALESSSSFRVKSGLDRRRSLAFESSFRV